MRKVNLVFIIDQNKIVGKQKFLDLQDLWLLKAITLLKLRRFLREFL